MLGPGRLAVPDPSAAERARGLAGRRGTMVNERPVSRRESAPGPDRCFAARLSLIADAPAAGVSPADLAAAAGLSQYRLTKAFLEWLGRYVLGSGPNFGLFREFCDVVTQGGG